MNRFAVINANAKMNRNKAGYPAGEYLDGSAEYERL